MAEQGQDTINITLIYRKLNGILTATEEERLQKWLEASAEHRRYFEQMRRYLEQVPECVVSEDEIDEAWEVLAGKVVSRRRRSWRIWGVYGTSVAAMFVLCLGGWMLWKGMPAPEKGEVREIVRNEIVPGQRVAILELANGEAHRLGVAGLQEKQIGNHITVDSCRLSYVRPDTQSLQVAYNRLSVPRGGEYQLKLEDGTKVWLNSDSRLKYPEVFVGSLREVFLEGEAYFEVAADSLKPFVVYAGEQQVKVLGTGFGITYYADEPFQTVTLVKGKVEVGFHESELGGFVLSPGKQVVYERNSRRVSCKNVDVREYVAWKDGKYVFAQKRLEEILNTLSRWYDFQVFYQNARCKDILFSGEIKRFEHFGSILDLIQKTSDVRFDIRGNTVQVMAN